MLAIIMAWAAPAEAAIQAPVNARIKAGCRMVLSNGGVHPIVGIAGDGTAANAAGHAAKTKLAPCGARRRLRR